MMPDARNVIARAIFETDFPRGTEQFLADWYEDSIQWQIDHEYADAILAALRDAGYEVVERETDIDYDQLQRINEHTRRPYRARSDDQP